MDAIGERDVLAAERVFTDLNDLVLAVGGAGSGEGTPVRYIDENFSVEYADGKFMQRK